METYEDSLENLKNAWGIGPGFMKTFPGITIDMSSGKNDIPGEIDMERARYLLNADDIFEEMLSQAA